MEHTPANPDAPYFDPQAWNNSNVHTSGANCLQYGVGGKNTDGTSKVYDESIPSPGMTAGFYPDATALYPNEFINRLAADGIHVVHSAKVPKASPGHYVIGVYLSPPSPDNPHPNYHVLRTDADGGWSEKIGTNDNDKVRRVFEPEADGYRNLPATYTDAITQYSLLGYAEIPSTGMDLGIEPYLARAFAKNPELNIDPLIASMTHQQRKAVAQTLMKKYPETAPVFITNVGNYYTKLVEQLTQVLVHDPNDPALDALFADSQQYHFLAKKLEVKPSLHEAFVSHYEQWADANALIDIARKSGVRALADELAGSSQSDLQRYEVEIGHLDPSMLSLYRQAEQGALSKQKTR